MAISESEISVCWNFVSFRELRLDPDQMQSLWTPLGAKPSVPQYRLALRARHECCPHTFQTVRGYASVSEVMKGILDSSVRQNSYGSQWQWHFSAIRPILFLLIQSTTVCTIHDIGHLHVLLIFFYIVKQTNKADYWCWFKPTRKR